METEHSTAAAVAATAGANLMSLNSDSEALVQVVALFLYSEFVPGSVGVHWMTVFHRPIVVESAVEPLVCLVATAVSAV